MELCPQETQPKDENLETLEELSRELKQISDSYFEMQGTILRMLHSDNSTSYLVNRAKWNDLCQITVGLDTDFISSF